MHPFLFVYDLGRGLELSMRTETFELALGRRAGDGME